MKSNENKRKDPRQVEKRHKILKINIALLNFVLVFAIVLTLTATDTSGLTLLNDYSVSTVKTVSAEEQPTSPHLAIGASIIKKMKDVFNPMVPLTPSNDKESKETTTVKLPVHMNEPTQVPQQLPVEPDQVQSVPVEPTTPEPSEPVISTPETVPVTDNNETAIPTSNKVVYLTFDDGPNKHTSEILDILDAYKIKGTFFMLGPQLAKQKDSVDRLIAEGHYLGMHSMSHDKQKLYLSGSTDQFISEFKEEQTLMNELFGLEPVLIRAPYGSKPYITSDFRGDIADAGFKMWDWTLDSLDWKYSNQPLKIVREVKDHASRDMEVILLHERAQTVEALPMIIAYLKRIGYQFEVYQPEHHKVVNFDHDERL